VVFAQSDRRLSQGHGAFHFQPCSPFAVSLSLQSVERSKFEHVFVGETAGAAGNGCIGCVVDYAVTWRYSSGLLPKSTRRVTFLATNGFFRTIRPEATAIAIEAASTLTHRP